MARRGNPAPIYLAAAAVGVAAAGVMLHNRRPKKTRRCAEYPYQWVPKQVDSEIAKLVQAGVRDPSLVAVEVASRLFGEHPTGGKVVFPPPMDARPEVRCVWERTFGRVQGWFADRGIVETISAPSSGWVIRRPWDEGYPWDEPALHPDNYPAPGMFFDASAPTRLGNTTDTDHTLDKVVRRALGTALVMSNMDPNLAVGTSSTSKRLRREMRHAILHSQYHDRLYGQYDRVKAGAQNGESHVVGQHGRGLNWMPYHDDLLRKIGDRRTPVRYTDYQGNPTMPKQGHSGMLLWIPAVDLSHLSDRVPRVQPFHWSNGVSTFEPPPTVQALGVDDSVLREGRYA